MDDWTDCIVPDEEIDTLLTEQREIDILLSRRKPLAK